MEGRTREARRLARTVPGWLAWGAVAALVTAAVGLWQLSDRAPLVWDEAARVSSGADLSFLLRSADVGGVWHWFTIQDYYPFLGPALHGLVYLLGGSAFTSAWVPPLLAYGLGGILTGRLARALGAGELGAWTAALVFWFTPIETKVAAGAFSEPMGACLELGVLLLLVSFQERGRRRLIIAAGALAGISSWVKYDYGLLAIATIAGSGAVVALSRRRLAALAPYAGGVAVALLMFLASMGPGWSKKIDGLRSFSGSASPGQSSIDFLGHPLSAFAHINPVYYPGALFSSWHYLLPGGEVGLSWLAAAALILAVGWAVHACRSRPALWPPLVFLALWLLVYSLAGVKFPRYIAPLIPVLAALAGAAALPAWRYMRGRGGRARRLAPILAGVLAIELVLQVAHLGDQFRFLKPDPVAAETIDYISARLPRAPGDRELLLIGQNNEVPVQGVRLAWTERLDKQAPGVEVVPDQPVGRRSGQVLRTVDGLRPLEVVGMDVSGTRLATHDFRLRFPAQVDYFHAARQLERRRLLRRVAATTTSHGGVRVAVWKLAPDFDTRVKAFRGP